MFKQIQISDILVPIYIPTRALVAQARASPHSRPRLSREPPQKTPCARSRSLLISRLTLMSPFFAWERGWWG